MAALLDLCCSAWSCENVLCHAHRKQVMVQSSKTCGIAHAQFDCAGARAVGNSLLVWRGL